MKTISSRHHRGVALVIILGLLVIILGLAVTFLNRTQVERSASSSYSAAASTRQFADLAVNLVQAQILQATSQGSQVAWTSQPGMVRTFDGSGHAQQAFKLFSADNLILSAPTAATLTTEFAIPATWGTDRAVWSDLNAPVTSGSATFYPILDPRAENQVEGFTINAPPGTDSQKGQMPVKWLYVLQNGTLVAPTGNGNTASVPGDTAANPITGRIAFWTDDETCKVNVNTASEGVPWDTPRVDTDQDRDLAKYQPAQKEFQRYPGHPATTSLAPIFFATGPTTTPALTQDQRNAIYKLVPRVNGGGSNGGSTVASGPVITDADRLYANIDEVIFSGSRGSQDPAAGIDGDKLERARFFLTANSRAPELTLFNTPRVSLWPLDATDAPTHRTAFDRLIAFCSTINGYPYYFTRSDPKSATADYDNLLRNRQLYGYLKALTDQPVPGFGGTFAAKLGTADRDQLLTEIFDYIRATNLNDSGLSTVANRFGERAETVLNPSSKTDGWNQVVPIQIGSTQGFGRVPVVSEVGIHFICTARADDPATLDVDESSGSNVATNKTLGDPATLLTANERRVEAMFFYETFIPSLSNPPMLDAYSVRITGLDKFQINGQPLGFPADATDLSFGNRGASIHGRDYGGSFSHRAALQGIPGTPGNQSRLPARGVMPADVGADDRNLYPFVSAPVTIDATAGTMSFTGGAITVEVYARTQNSAPGYASGAQPVQRLTMNFPSSTLSGPFPIPDLVAAGTPASGSSAIATDKENWWTFSLDGAIAGKSGRIQGWSRTPSPFSSGWDGSQILLGDPFHPNDVVRSMVPAQNDYRLLAVDLPPGSAATTFVKHPLYDNSGANFAHAVSENYNAPAIRGRSVQAEGYPGPGSGVSYPASLTAWGGRSQPDVPIASTVSATGDWDNGMAIYPDGPYINRPDEGNIFNISTTTPYYDSSEQYTGVDQTFFSPNRQMPSAGMLGSLPSQARTGVGFQTLLFRPQPGHFGAGSPPDHLITDLFWMPVVEPYAISEPFSTAGKINMNFAIAPFGSFVTRSTGIVSVLRSERILAIPNNKAATYKLGATVGSRSDQFRLSIDAHKTLEQFEDVFDGGNVFRSASDIMALYLVPVGETVAGMASFWDTHRLTGDNTRERPYANLLGRLTTKSNTYTVHYRVQALKRAPGGTEGTWDESRDKVLSEHRGSTVLERYINPNDTSIIDYATASYPLGAGEDLGSKYKWRVLSVNTFAP